MRVVPGVYLLKFESGRGALAVYVGASNDVHRRIAAHRKKLRRGLHENRRIRLAWAVVQRTRGRFSWRVRELPGVTAEDLRRFEQRLVDHWVLRLGWDRLLNNVQDVQAILRPSGRQG